MANFDITFGLTVAHEGYYASEEFWRRHGDTRSGETYMGVDRIANPTWDGWKIIDGWKATHGTPKWNFRFPLELGLEPLVIKAAKEKYWDIMHGDAIKTQAIANLIFEMLWGSGGWGIKQVQKSINVLIAPKKIGVDGNLGTKESIPYINSLPQVKLYETIYHTRRAWYVEQRNAGNPNADSWLSRLAKYPETITVT